MTKYGTRRVPESDNDLVTKYWGICRPHNGRFLVAVRTPEGTLQARSTECPDCGRVPDVIVAEPDADAGSRDPR